MNKDLLIDGEKFISAKRAGLDLGYSADYIGQLARSGAVSGKMVGRTWFVSRRSLLRYRKDNGSEKSIKLGRPALGKKEIYINGEKFISSIVAARESGYTTDYVGQLIRGGVVEGKMMGRAWYVSRKSLLAYKKQNSFSAKLPQELVITAPSLPVIRSVNKYPTARVLPKLLPKAQVKSEVKSKSISYLPEKLSPLPNLSKEKPQTNYSRMMRHTVTVSLSLMIISAVSYSWIGFLSPSSADSIDMKIALAMNTADVVMAPVRTGSSHLASALGSGVKDFFSGILSGVTPVAAPQVAEVKTKPLAEGVVVTEDGGDHLGTVQKIKNIFSDEVSIYGDADGASGIITPVFKESSSTGSYTYVLVPIKDKNKENN
ncbi:hypothetical protein KW800_02830 [Candidatus Parcubacteria bacterium]|nr:hypothetical protein [Candidatus Parcubacteria bacterium]